jgi:hypothetical protein
MPGVESQMILILRTHYSSMSFSRRRLPVKAGLVDSADKIVETSLDAADTSVRATQASLVARLR